MPEDPARVQEKLARNVERAIDMLTKQFGNTAMNEKRKQQEKEIVEKWLKLTNEQGEHTQEFQNMVEIWAKDNRSITKKFMDGVKGWAKTQMESRTAIGHTMRFVASTWKSASEKIIQPFRNLFGRLKSATMEVLGPVGDALALVKDFILAPFRFLGGLIKHMINITPPGDRKRNRLLRDMRDMMQMQMKMDILDDKTTKKKMPITGIATLLAALLGAGIARFLIPFRAIGKVLRIGATVKRIKDFFLSIELFAKPIGKIKLKFIEWGGKIKEIFAPFSKIFGKVGILSKFGGMVSNLGAAFKFGFRVLGLPLTILLGVIDFIRGFISTEGDIGDKIIGGFKFAVFKLLELPAKLVGWLIEKALGLFGVKVDGVADGILGFVMGAIDFFATPFKVVKEFIKGFFGEEGTFIERLKAGFKAVLDFIPKMFNGIIDWLIESFGFIPGVKGLLEKAKFNIPTEPVVDVARKEAEKEKQRKREEDKKHQEQKKAQEDLNKSIESTSQASQIAMTNMGSRMMGFGGGGQTPQIPDEIDNNAITFKNIAMEFGD